MIYLILENRSTLTQDLKHLAKLKTAISKKLTCVIRPLPRHMHTHISSNKEAHMKMQCKYALIKHIHDRIFCQIYTCM